MESKEAKSRESDKLALHKVFVGHISSVIFEKSVFEKIFLCDLVRLDFSKLSEEELIQKVSFLISNLKHSILKMKEEENLKRDIF